VGGGIHVSGGHDALLALAEAGRIPVAHTMSGKGAIACTHPLSLGVFGRYSRIANDFVAEADLLIVVGCKLGEIATRRFALMPAGVPVVHVEIVPEEIGRTTRADVALAADAQAWRWRTCWPRCRAAPCPMAARSSPPPWRRAWRPGASAPPTGWNRTRRRSMSAA
jgi:thiamine pyrophosphate-dependent acetolactate synthase large subunit-like protein